MKHLLLWRNSNSLKKTIDFTKTYIFHNSVSGHSEEIVERITG